MASSKPIAPLALAIVVGGMFVSSPAMSSSSARTPPGPAGPASALDRSLARSRQLWATVDVCGPANKPSTIGIRGSMPSDGHPKDTMYMRFRVQYLDPATRAWANVTHGGDSGPVKVGRADAVRQAGVSFQFASRSAFMLRGLVMFQWRRGRTVVATQSRTTSAGHHSLLGADPAGYSAATCRLS